MAPVIFTTASFTIPSASSTASIPSAPARRATAVRARPASSRISPPSGSTVPSRPRTTLASVTVGSSPPRP